MKRTVILYLIALIPVAFGVWISLPYYYHGENKLSAGSDSYLSILIGWLIGIVFLILTKTIRWQKPPISHFVFYVLLCIVMTMIMTGGEEELLKKEGVPTEAVVIKQVDRRYMGLSIQYTYQFGSETFKKWDNQKKFIQENDLKKGDTLEILVAPSNPHIHEFVGLMKDEALNN
jgi:hypothetical protein